MAQTLSRGVEIGIGCSVARTGGVKPKEANWSAYHQARMVNNGEPVNACPFGCEDESLDQHGRCYHRVGVSPDGESYEPEARRADGQLVMKIRRKRGPDGKVRPVLERVDPKRHVLVQVTTSFLVYEDRECPDGWLPAEDDEETEDEPEVE